MMKPYARHHSGNQGESLACEYLLEKGLVMIEKNYSCKVGEVDLIMRDQDMGEECLVFVEVRFRTGRDHCDAAESITVEKQQRLVAAAKQYLVSIDKYDKIACRFDVIAINNALKTHNIHWYKDAIEAS